MVGLLVVVVLVAARDLELRVIQACLCHPLHLQQAEGRVLLGGGGRGGGGGSHLV